MYGNALQKEKNIYVVRIIFKKFENKLIINVNTSKHQFTYLQD